MSNSKTLAKYTVGLGGELVAHVRIKECAPADPPQSGADWSAETDWPRVYVEVNLPTIPGTSTMAFALQLAGKQWPAFDGDRWSVRADQYHYLCHARVQDGLTAAREYVEAWLRPIRAHHEARLARLEERERRTAAAREGVQYLPETDQ